MNSFLSRIEKGFFLFGALVSVLATLSAISSTALHYTQNRTQVLASNQETFPEYSTIPIIFSAADEPAGNQSEITQVNSWVKYIQAWFAVRLNSKTFSSPPTRVVVGQHPRAWYAQCQTDPCYPVDTSVYHNILKDLKELGYPVGAPSIAKAHLLVFFKTSVPWEQVAGGGAEEQNINMSYISLNYALQDLNGKDPFSFDISLSCPFAQKDCVPLSKLGTITHEMAHTYGFSHQINPSNIDSACSIILGPSLFPHTGFCDTETTPELPKILNSPFMNNFLSQIPSPLSRLSRIKYTLLSGWNLLSLPISFPGTSSNQAGTLASVVNRIFSSCEKAELIEAGQWKTYICASIQQDPVNIAQAQAFWIKMKEKADLVIFGLTPSSRPSVSLKKGWNLVGPPWQSYSLPLTESFKSFTSALNLAYYYDSAVPESPWKKYNPAAPAFLNNLSQIESGKGYWIEVKNDSLWTFETPSRVIARPQKFGLNNYSLPK